MDRVTWRTQVLSNHLNQPSMSSPLSPNPCVGFSPPELSEPFEFDTKEMRKLLDAHNLEDRDWLFGLMKQSKLFNPREAGGRVFVSPDYNQSMEQQREMTMKRIAYLLDRGVFEGWLTEKGVEAELRKLALHEVIGIYDHSLAVKLAVHFFSGGSIQFFGTKRHHDKWLRDTENYAINGCFAMSELGMGIMYVEVRGIETVTNYDSTTGELSLILLVNQLRMADVFSDGQYLSAIKDPDQRFAAFLAPLTSSRVSIAVGAIYSSQISLAIAIRYSLTRRPFSVTPKGPEVLLLDYPSHQQRLLPLLAKTYAMSFAANHLKMIYVKRTPELSKTIHVVSSAFKATLTWHNMRTLQECREACGGQGLKTENRIGPLKGEYDAQSTFEGDNNVLMQQVSKALLGEYIAAQKRSKPFKALGLEHMNKPCPVIPSQLTSSTLQSSQFQMDAFCLRERDLLNRFAMEVSERQKQGESKEYSVILIWAELSQIQTLLDAEAGVPSGSLKLQNVLAMLRSMYALICLEEDPAFLRFGYLSTDNVAAVRKEVSGLCGELRPHALALVSSFGIPDAF
ncbi:Acyl-coenzyme A oxidase 3 peroxisomal [Prunus yedoensis var. nudiflora]|uniref:Acyl-coenzyme A oxidase n=1 Tax=Prunus yedoensis var. nudiflora TaxID=2094558 RepID=A0A314Y241_PRUYE|nr:Acyl-coenzyme A oxidase 3 peroxisomal [Prunus yedoensis var. nudiflora]